MPQAYGHSMETLLSHLPGVQRLLSRKKTALMLARRLDPNSEQWQASQVARRLSPRPSELLKTGMPVATQTGPARRT